MKHTLENIADAISPNIISARHGYSFTTYPENIVEGMACLECGTKTDYYRNYCAKHAHMENAWPTREQRTRNRRGK